MAGRPGLRRESRESIDVRCEHRWGSGRRDQHDRLARQKEFPSRSEKKVCDPHKSPDECTGDGVTHLTRRQRNKKTMNTKALSSVAILGMVASLFVGCGDGDSTKIKICSPRAVKCL